MEDLYIDGFRITTNPYGVNIVISSSNPDPPTDGTISKTDLAIVRMSLEHAKVMTMVLRQVLKKREREIAPIVLPGNLLNQLGIAQGDW